MLKMKTGVNMSLQNALLIVLYLNEGKARTQFIWNLLLFFAYMELSDTVPMNPIKFTSTKFGPWCHKIPMILSALETKGLIATPPWDLEDDGFDDDIAKEYIEPKYYILTDNGRKVISLLLDTYHIDLQAQEIDCFREQLQLFICDTVFLIEIVKELYPDMIRSKYEKVSRLPTGSNHKKPDGVVR